MLLAAVAHLASVLPQLGLRGLAIGGVCVLGSQVDSSF